MKCILIPQSLSEKPGEITSKTTVLFDSEPRKILNVAKQYIREEIKNRLNSREGLPPQGSNYFVG
jgi:hypothetical protein